MQAAAAPEESVRALSAGGTSPAQGVDASAGPALATAIPLHASQGVPSWWEALFARSSYASSFVSPAWIQTWLEVYGAGFSGSWVCWESAGEIVGGCLVLERSVRWHSLPVRSVYLNAGAESQSRSPLTEYNHALCLPGYEELIGRSVAAYLNGLSWSRAELWGHEDGPFFRALLSELSQCGLGRRTNLARFVNLSGLGGKEYESTLSSKTRSQIRRCRRMYEEAHGVITVSIASDAEEAIRWLQEMAELHNATWTARGRSGAFEHEEYVAFHHRIVRRLWDSKGVEVLRVRANDRPIGYLYNFLHAGKVSCFQSGFVQESDPHLKPGLLTHAMAIAHYAQRGFSEYDLLSGDSRYKRSLTKTTRELHWTTVYRGSVYGRLLNRLTQLQRYLTQVRSRVGAAQARDDSAARETSDD